MAGNNENSEVHHREWARSMAHDGVSDAVTPLEMTPEEMYRAAGWEDFGGQPSPDEVKVAAGREATKAFWGKDFLLKDGRDLEIAKRTDWAMITLLRDPELQQIFTGTAKDFDTIHELQGVVSAAVREAFTDGFTTCFDETKQTGL